MSAPLTKVAPPPLTPEQRAQRKKQRRLIVWTLLGLVLAVATWQGVAYYISAPERAEAQVQAGTKNMLPGKYEQAIVQFNQALATDPNSWNAYYQRAIAEQNLDSIDAALADFQAALQINPNLFEAHVSLAGIYSDRGDHRHAIEELTKVIAQRPTVDGYYRRGLAHQELGEHQEAIDDFNWIIDATRDAPLVYWARAKSKRALGDLDGAAEDDQIAQSFDRSSDFRKK